MKKSTTTTTSIDQEHLAAVAAAVALVLGEAAHTIVHVEKLEMQPNASFFVLNPWSMEGRFEHFGSHRVR